MGVIIKEYGKVQVSKRKRYNIIRVRNNGKTSLKKICSRKPYTQPLSESELVTVKNKLDLN